jgi:hypothetical protein
MPRFVWALESTIRASQRWISDLNVESLGLLAARKTKESISRNSLAIFTASETTLFMAMGGWLTERS